MALEQPSQGELCRLTLGITRLCLLWCCAKVFAANFLGGFSIVTAKLVIRAI
jgi:hypothetical protein